MCTAGHKTSISHQPITVVTVAALKETCIDLKSHRDLAHSLVYILLLKYCYWIINSSHAANTRIVHRQQVVFGVCAVV